MKQLRIRAQRCSNLIKARGYILGSLSYLVIICIVFALFFKQYMVTSLFRGFCCFRRIYIFTFNLIQMFSVRTCCKWTSTYLNCNFNWGCSGQKPWFSFPLVLQNQYFTQSKHGSTVGVIGLINDWKCLDDFLNGFFYWIKIRGGCLK